MYKARIEQATWHHRESAPNRSRIKDLRPYDVRLQREITHRRLAISLLRRALRIVSLHLLDGAVIVAVVALLARTWPGASAAQSLTFSIAAIFLISLDALAAYQPGDARRDRRRLFLGVALAVLILSVLTVFPPRLPLSATFLAAVGALGLVCLAVGRKIADLLVRQAYVHGLGLRRAVIIGNLDEVGCAIRRLRDDRNIDQYIVGHLSRADVSDPTAMGRVADLPRVLDESDVQEVVVAGTLSAEALREVTQSCFDRGTALYVLPSVYKMANCRAEPCRVGPATLVRVHPARLEVPSLLVKRVFDVVAAALALLVLAPLVALIALAIRLDSPGPIFFRQQRVGLGGRRFTMWKFRSMCLDAEARERDIAHLNIYGLGGAFKIHRDPRITRVGYLLRRTSLDELPQLLNVLFGDMSLVGPRPVPPRDLDCYLSHHFERLSVVPGITGPWQVGGRSLITDFETIVRMEREYIRSWSLFLDAKILLRTVGVVIRGEGAY